MSFGRPEQKPLAATLEAATASQSYKSLIALHRLAESYLNPICFDEIFGVCSMYIC